MSSKYYDSSGKDVTNGEIAYAEDLNSINGSTDSAFQQVEVDVITAVDSAQSYSDKAKEWAENPEDTQVEVGQYSSLHWSSKSSGFASDSSTSASASNVSALASEASNIASGLSASASATSAGESSTSATASASSAIASQASAVDSDTSAIASGNSATASNLSASLAGASATDSENSAIASEASTVASLASQVASAISAFESATSAGEALVSATDALNEADRAEGYADSINPSTTIHTVGSGLPNELEDLAVKITSTVLTVGQDWNGVAYTDPDAIGANPTALIYPDGTIVGSTDNGNYTKYPNGELVCTHTETIADSGSWVTTASVYRSGVITQSYPIEFVEIPSASPGEFKPGVGVGWSTVRSVTIASVSMYGYDTVDRTNNPVTLGYIAIGRWK